VPPSRNLVPSGLVLVDKPVGRSSFAVVRGLRDATGARAGHAGTLDPFAGGLLLVLLGAATRLARYLVGLDKRYLAEIDLTARTTTGDPEGAVAVESLPPSRDELESRLATLRGEVELRIPAASAVKIGGQRAYRLARRGLDVEMPVRRSIVHELQLTGFDGTTALLDLRVSSGTYVRSIADALGGHCRMLRRLEVGPFLLADADPSAIVPPAEALPFLPAVDLDASEVTAVRAGRVVDGPGEGPVRLLDAGSLVAVGRAGGGSIRPETVLP
jgi:tRNA pseudouridine55 synthase